MTRTRARGIASLFIGLVLELDDPQTFLGGLPSTVPLAAGFGTRNLGVAMAIAVTLLGRVEFARFAYTYFLIEMPLMLVAITVFRRRLGDSFRQA